MRRPVQQVADLLTLGAYAGGWAFVRALPEPVAVRLFDLGADLAARRGGKGVQRLRSNLERVAPGQDLTRAALRSYARYWREVFRLQVTPPERILGGMHTVGEERFRAALATGRGVILALPHSGNWDHAGAWCGLTGAPFTTVAERLEPAGLFDRFVQFRQSLGMEVLPLTGGDRPPYDVLVERLEAGGMLCLLADRDLSARGIDVQFFGATARMPAGPASLALRTGAVLLPVTLAFTDDGWLCTWHEEVAGTDVATMTQQLADAFAAGIAAHPADWHMLQRLWLEDLAADDPRRVPVA
ncbi:MAG: lipid biosynthesis acyltransferase [Frankiales bacterium]|nr:lipid biosynthesis acyltransferase [Frankiales bacterium]